MHREDERSARAPREDHDDGGVARVDRVDEASLLRAELARERERADALAREVEALRSSVKTNHELPAMFELQAIGVAQTDPRTARFVRVNRRFCDITGYTPDELYARTIHDITHPEDRERDKTVYSSAIAGIDGAWVSEKRYLRKDGRIVWVLVSGTVIHGSGGTPETTLATIQDIDEQKRAEQAEKLAKERLEQVLGSITAAHFALDCSCRFLEVNQGAEAMIFGKRADELVGRSFWEVFPEGVGSEFWKQYRGAIEDGKERHFEGKSRIVDKWFEAHVYPNLSEDRLDVYVRDVTERKRSEEALREGVDRLRDADRRKDEFLAMLGHELRNPLAPILMAVELLRLRLPTTPEMERLRDVIERQVRHLTRLVDDLLEVSRITLGKIRLDKQAVDARGIVARAIETTRPLIEARGHELAVDIPDELLMLEADPVRVAQVLANLLNNAAKYTAEGGHIECSVARSLCGERIVFRVKDDGIGLAKEMLESVFEMFTQSERSLDRAEGGLGLGLTLARRLVEMHGGTLIAESEGLNKGSVFTASLPALPSAKAETDEGSHVGHGKTGGRVLRALVVDDNADAADMLAALLELLGQEVIIAHDGPAALDLARKFEPDVVLLDIGLPRMDGLEVARLVRESSRRRPLIVAVTGYAQEDDRVRSLQAGFDEHLVKPVDVRDIEKLIERARMSRGQPA